MFKLYSEFIGYSFKKLVSGDWNTGVLVAVTLLLFGYLLYLKLIIPALLVFVVGSVISLTYLNFTFDRRCEESRVVSYPEWDFRE